MVISVSSISKFFGKKAALNDVSIIIPKGSLNILVGPNGAGKTTLLRCMAGELKPNYGFVRVESGYTIAVAEENRDFFKGFDASDYLKLWMLLYPDFSKEQFFRMLSIIGIPSDKPVETYSKGMKTWLHNSLVISSNAKIMIFDEPLQHLDPSVRMSFHSILKEQTAKGITLIISTHEIDEFHQYADNVAIIHHSKIIYSGEVSKTVFSHRIVLGTQSAEIEETVGPIFNEKLLKTSRNIGRNSSLKEIVAAYINGSDLKNAQTPEM